MCIIFNLMSLTHAKSSKPPRTFQWDSVDTSPNYGGQREGRREQFCAVVSATGSSIEKSMGLGSSVNGGGGGGV